MKPHEVFLAYSSMEQVDVYAEFVHLANELLVQDNKPVQDIARALVVVAAQYCYVGARRLGYSEMDTKTINEMTELFRSALRSSNNDINIRQVLPH